MVDSSDLGGEVWGVTTDGSAVGRFCSLFNGIAVVPLTCCSASCEAAGVNGRLLMALVGLFGVDVPEASVLMLSAVEACREAPSGGVEVWESL